MLKNSLKRLKRFKDQDAILKKKAKGRFAAAKIKR